MSLLKGNSRRIIKRNSRSDLVSSVSGSPPFLAPFALPVQPVLDALSISPGSVVLEIGDISCRFTLPVAKYFATKGGSGSVYACDFNETGISQTYQKAKDAHLAHLVTPLFWNTGDSRGMPLDDDTADVIIAISPALFKTNPRRLVKESLRVLRTGGKLFIAEWLDSRKALLRFGTPPGISKSGALDILDAMNDADCAALNIPELEWGVLATKRVHYPTPPAAVRIGPKGPLKK